MIAAVLFDFGGVLAEEGFHDGLRAIGIKYGHDPEDFFHTVDALIYETGYLTGREDEAAFWTTVKRRTGIRADDNTLRKEILTRFILRPEMLAQVDLLRHRGISVAILSDQTNWLEEINEDTALYKRFDRVFNSFRVRKSKRDATIFADVCAALSVKPNEVLFVDDNINHVRRAKAQGLQTIHFVGIDDFKKQLVNYVP